MTAVHSVQTKAHPTPLASDKVFFPNLDGLRFLAFFMVFLQHGFSAPFRRLPLDGLPERLRTAVFSHGDLGVSFFFVLSGFLITFLLIRETDRTGSIDVPAFYMRRILRIWPLYYLVLFFGFVLNPLSKSVAGLPPLTEVGNPIYYMTFLSNFDVIRLGGYGPMFTNITWSVAIEQQFYLLWPALLWATRPSAHKYVFIAIIAISALFRYVNIGNYLVTYFHTLAVISDMAVGGLAAHLIARRRGFKEFFESFPTKGTVGVYMVAVTVVFFSGFLQEWRRLWLPSGSAWPSATSYHAYELPFLRLKERFSVIKSVIP